MEELHVGDPRPGAISHGDPVTRGDVRVGGVEVDLPGSARREHGHRGYEGVDLSRLLLQDESALADAVAVLPSGHDKVDGHEVLEDLHARQLPHSLDQGPDHLLAGGVVRVDDPAGRVSAFSTQIQHLRVILAGGEPGPQVLKLPDGLRALAYTQIHHIIAAESAPGRLGVLDVRLEAVVVIRHRCHAALSAVCRGVFDRVLGKENNLAAPGHLPREC